jgi:hypothetical protein
MKVIGGLLDRFKNLEAPERVVRDATIKSISDVLNIDINNINIKLSNKGVLYIHIQSSIKAGIFEYKDVLISRINNILNKNQIRDIK